MADQLGMSDLIIHQALHGYADGHRLLDSSSVLDTSDGRLMLVLSDTSGPLSTDADNGFLTGYPLPKSKKYVLARTWSAPEMPRPGCVWTHSLIVDFADLAIFRDVRPLLRLFKRPSDETSPTYHNSLIAPTGASNNYDIASERAVESIVALYATPHEQVTLDAGEPVQDEELLLAVWMQQWPRLRRSFRFCTSAGRGRSSSDYQFDLQLRAAGIAPRSAVEQSKRRKETLEALQPLINDLRDGSMPELRNFLRRAGGDVDQGRAAMLPLCVIFSGIHSKARDYAGLSRALLALKELGPKQAKAARREIAIAAIDNIDLIDRDVLIFALSQALDGSLDLDSRDLTHLAQAFWSHDPWSFAQALDDEGALPDAVRAMLPMLSTDVLLTGLTSSPDAAVRVAAGRPDILENPGVWTINSIDVVRMLALASATNAGPSVIKAILISIAPSYASTVVRAFGAFQVLRAIAELYATDSKVNIDLWVSNCAQQPGEIARALVEVIFPKPVLASIAKRMSPDDVPNDYGDDPWAIAIARSTDHLEFAVEETFAAFIFARALGFKSKTPARLFAFSFDRTHTAIEMRRLNDDVWRPIDRRVAWSFWNDWDRCARIRQAMVNKFVDHDLDHRLFARVTGKGGVFKSLVDFAAITSKGRRYLQAVHEAIKSDSEPFMHKRDELIVKKLK